MLLERGSDGGYEYKDKFSVAPYSFSGGPSQALVTIAIALAVVGTVCLSLRVYARIYILNFRTTGWSLSAALVSWMFCLPTSVLWALSAEWGLGENFAVAELNPNIEQALLFEWIAVVLSLFATWFGKVSALIYIFDVQGPTHRNWRWFLIGLVTVNLLVYIMVIPAFFLQCSPAEKLWKPNTDGSCMNGKTLFVLATFAGSWGALTDLVLALYPSILISRLQLKLRLKLGLSLLLGLGGFTAACAIIKTMLFCAFQVQADQTYDNAGFVYWSIAEMWVILIVGSIPPLWPIGRSLGGRWSQLVSSGGGGGSGNRNGSSISTLKKPWAASYRRGGSEKGRSSTSGDDDAVTLGAISYYGAVVSNSNDNNTDRSGIYRGGLAAGIGGADDIEAESRSAARRYFYEYGCKHAAGRSRGAAANPFAQYGSQRDQACCMCDVSVSSAAGSSITADDHDDDRCGSRGSSSSHGTAGASTTRHQQQQGIVVTRHVIVASESRAAAAGTSKW